MNGCKLNGAPHRPNASMTQRPPSAPPPSAISPPCTARWEHGPATRTTSVAVSPRSELREQLALAAGERQERDAASHDAARDAEAAAQRVNRDAQAAVRAVEALQHARRQVGTLHEQ